MTNFLTTAKHPKGDGQTDNGYFIDPRGDMFVLQQQVI